MRIGLFYFFWFCPSKEKNNCTVLFSSFKVWAFWDLKKNVFYWLFSRCMYGTCSLPVSKEVRWAVPFKVAIFSIVISSSSRNSHVCTSQTYTAGALAFIWSHRRCSSDELYESALWLLLATVWSCRKRSNREILGGNIFLLSSKCFDSVGAGC